MTQGTPFRNITPGIPAPKQGTPFRNVIDAALAPKQGTPARDVRGEPIPDISASPLFLYTIVPIVPTGCFPDTEPLFPGTEKLISAGTFGRCPPRDFQVLDVKPGEVTLGWLVVVKADLNKDDLLFSVDGDVFADISDPPEHIFASKRSVLGYKLHRGAPGFEPVGTTEGSGNCIADEGTLNAGTTQFVDNTVAPGTMVAYLIATVLDDGA